jgi:GT2 family glycosyltransferase
MNKKFKKISILICSKSRRQMLKNLVQELLQLNSDFILEIVVVEETDIVEPIAGVKYVSHPFASRGVGYARNLALKHATGEILVFVDDDCKVSPGWLEKLIQPLLEDDSVLGVQGGVSVPAQSNIVGWAETLLGFPGGGLKRILEAEEKWEKTENISTLNCAYRRTVLEQIGGFDERLAAGSEDYVLSKKASKLGRCLFVPEAVVLHEPRGNLGKIWNWFVMRGRADIEVIYTKKLKRAKFRNLFMRSLVAKIAGIGVLLIASYLLQFAILLPLALLAYVLLQIIRYYRVWRLSRCSLPVLLVIPLIKIVMDLAADCGRFKRLTNEP